MTAKQIGHVKPGFLALALIDLVQGGRDIELAALTTQDATPTEEQRLGDAVLSFGPGWREG